MKKKMTDGERLIWAAAYADALSWPGGHGVGRAANHANDALGALHRAVQQDDGTGDRITLEEFDEFAAMPESDCVAELLRRFPPPSAELT